MPIRIPSATGLGTFTFRLNNNPFASMEDNFSNLSDAGVDTTFLQGGMTAQVVTGMGNPNNLLLGDAKSSHLAGLFRTWHPGYIQQANGNKDISNQNQTLAKAA